MFKIWKIYTCATCDYLLIHTIYKFSEIVSIGNLPLGYPLINRGYRWSHGFGQMALPGTNVWCTTPYLKCQPDVIKLVK